MRTGRVWSLENGELIRAFSSAGSRAINQPPTASGIAAERARNIQVSGQPRSPEKPNSSTASIATSPLVWAMSRASNRSSLVGRTVAYRQAAMGFRRRRVTPPTRPKPTIIIAQAAGSGTPDGRVEAV
jgi:hypothetical protein